MADLLLHLPQELAMTRQKVLLAAAAAFALSLGPVWAQERTAPTQDTGPSGGSRGGGEAVGRAVERADPAPSTSSGSSGGGASTASSSGSSRWDAPSRASEPPRSGDAPQRSGQRAVPRGSAGGSDSGGGRTAGTASTRGGSGVDRNNDRGRDRSAVPVYARPRGGQPAVGTPAERRGPIPGRGGIDVLYLPSSYYYYDPYYLRSRSYGSYWLPGYGYGLGYFGYDPFFWSNYGYGAGYGSPYYGGGGGYSGYAYPTQRYDTGSLRLKVKPADGQVYVDGYFVGVVDSFDGMFQRLSIEAGTHRIEIRAEGYEPVQFEVLVTPGETVTYKGEMIRRQP
jgi:hypothetical protein